MAQQQPGDVACDFCSRRKLKAVKTCLQCRVSYCDAHLLQHCRSPALQAHKLVKASGELGENVCPRHDEARTLSCRIDQQCICSRCSAEQHKGHEVVSAAAERAERQKGLAASLQNIRQRIQERERDVRVLRGEIRNINHSADRAAERSDAFFAKLTASAKRGRTGARELIRDRQKREVSLTEEQIKCVEQEVIELEGRDAELEQLSHAEDHMHFLRSYGSLSRISESARPVSSDDCPQISFEDVTAAAAKARDELEDALREEGTSVWEAVNGVDVLRSTPPGPGSRRRRAQGPFLQTNQLEDIIRIKKLKRAFVGILFLVIALTHRFKSSLQPQCTHGERSAVQGHLNTTLGWLEPTTRAEFLQYAVPMPPYTEEQDLPQSEGNKKVTEVPSYPLMPQTIIAWAREGLTGRRYWEVDWSGKIADIVVSYKDFSPHFGYSDNGWSLRCGPCGYIFKHINSLDKIPGAAPSRVGVYLDHSAGTLSFYEVSDTMILLHRVHTTFIQPVYAGLGWLYEGDNCDYMKSFIGK